MVPFLRGVLYTSVPSSVTTASACPKRFRNPLAEGSSLDPGACALCGVYFYNSLILLRWKGGEAAAYQFHILYPPATTRIQTYTLPAFISKGHTGTWCQTEARAYFPSVFVTPVRSVHTYCSSHCLWAWFLCVQSAGPDPAPCSGRGSTSPASRHKKPFPKL